MRSTRYESPDQSSATGFPSRPGLKVSFAATSPFPNGKPARWIWMALLSALITVSTYLLAVRTYTGQYIENAALIGAKNASGAEVNDALNNLNVISYASLVVAVIVIGIIGVFRKSWRIGAAGIGIIGGATVTTEILKRFVLQRPDLAPIYENNAHNSFPSGHTTIAMSIFVALLVVVPYRWRGMVLLLTITWSTAVGAATITTRWHRFSDTLSADMIAFFFGALALIWLSHQGLLRRSTNRIYPLRTIFVTFLSFLAAGGLTIGLFIAVMTSINSGIGSVATTAASGAVSDTNFTYNMFLAAQVLASSFSIFSTLWIWATMRRLESGDPTDPKFLDRLQRAN